MASTARSRPDLQHEEPRAGGGLQPRGGAQQGPAERLDLQALVGRVIGGPPGAAGRPALRQGPELVRLAHAGAGELGQELGLGSAAAGRLEAAFELGRRLERMRLGDAPRLSDPATVERLLAPRARGLQREEFWGLLLDGRHRLLSIEQVSVGTLTCSLVHPREVFAPAIAARAAALVVAHNHPSGDSQPSAEDRVVTARLRAAGELLGIPLVDHVIIGLNQFRSMRQEPDWGAVPEKDSDL